MTNFVFYNRVARDDQEDSEAARDQGARILAHIEAGGWVNVAEYIDDTQGRRQMINLAFYGRVSTEDNQDPEASRQWQLTRSRALIEPRGGVIVAEYFDVD
jgi:hypothetical protein